MKPGAGRSAGHARRNVSRRVADAVQEERDALAVEEPLEIRVEARPVAVTMRTPGHDDELALGFLYTEGVVTTAADVVSVAAAASGRGREEPNVIDVRLRDPSRCDFARLTRHVFTASSCGLCGKATIAAVQARHAPLELAAAPTVSARVLSRLPDALAAAQCTFQLTGGLHAASLFNRAGELMVTREDVGRHNAVDKVVGHLLRRPEWNAAELGLLVSGRVAFEICQKALAARLGFIAAFSAPTTLAVDFARAGGQTLVGFLRSGRMNVYAGPDRVVD